MLLLKVLERMLEKDPTLNLFDNLPNSSRLFKTPSLFLQSVCLPTLTTFLPIDMRAIRAIPPLRFRVFLFSERYCFGYTALLDTLGGEKDIFQRRITAANTV